MVTLPESSKSPPAVEIVPPERKTRLPQGSPIIQAQNASVVFRDRVGLFDMTLDIPRGIIFSLIGPSGSGKTTTVRMLTGLYKPTRGTVRVIDQDPTKFTTKTREQIGYMPQQMVLYPQLTTLENLNFVASLYGMFPIGRGKRLRSLLDFVELEDARHRLAGQLSMGMQRRLAIAAALVNDPQLIFADEPTAGIDPILRAKFWDNFRQLRDEGRTLFITTQYVGEAAYCDYVGVMRKGRLVEMDTPENLKRKAMGGDVIRLVVDKTHEREAMRLLDLEPDVMQVQRSLRQPGELLVYTADAARTMPELVMHLNGGSGIQLQTMEKYEPPFDEIFVNLIRQDEENA